MRPSTSLASSLAHSVGGRLFGVFWGSLVVIDLVGPAHVPLTVATGAVVLVVAVGSWRQSVPTALAAAAMGWMFVNGFLVNNLGQLGWGGFPDLWRLVLLVAVASVAAWAGDLDAFLTPVRRPDRSARVSSRAEPSDPARSVGRESHAVSR